LLLIINVQSSVVIPTSGRPNYENKIATSKFGNKGTDLRANLKPG
jgi:hypothetical protein